MVPVLRWYQSKLKTGIAEAWGQDAKVVLAVAPTGAGKTVLFGSVVHDHAGASCVIAHRQELVSQISMMLAVYGVRHRIIAADKTVKAIVKQQIDELGRSFYDANARAGVASVDTLVGAKAQQHKAWLQQVTLWVQDEGHHLLRENKWGRAAAMFPNAKGLLVTATPCRADGMGLGRHAAGIVDAMVVGPGMRELIDQGYLTDYRVVVAQTHLDLSQVTIGTDGDYSLKAGKGKAAVRGSSIVGDVVATYQKWAAGKLGVCFASDVETAGDIAAKFRAAGIPSEMVDGTTPDDQRRDILRRFRRRELMVLVNVDLFGEGFDLPAIEVVMMARATLSFAVYAQQWGRALRLILDPAVMRNWDNYTPEQRLQLIAASAKARALIIDHVGNFVAHNGPPDRRNDWSLDTQERRGRQTDAEPMAECLNPECLSPYARALPCCPFCLMAPAPGPGGRSSPAAVDGNLFELDAETLAAFRGAQAETFRSNDQVRAELTAQRLPGAWVMSNVKKHDERRRVAEDLRDAMAWWAGERRAEGQSDAEIYKRFFLTFGVDWLSAFGLDKAAMATLSSRVAERLTAASSAARVQSDKLLSR